MNNSVTKTKRQSTLNSRPWSAIPWFDQYDYYFRWEICYFFRTNKRSQPSNREMMTLRSESVWSVFFVFLDMEILFLPRLNPKMLKWEKSSFDARICDWLADNDMKYLINKWWAFFFSLFPLLPATYAKNKNPRCTSRPTDMWRDARVDLVYLDSSYLSLPFAQHWFRRFSEFEKPTTRNQRKEKSIN